MATITGDGVAQEIQVRILDFLNSVSTAADIAGTEPQAGPIHDDPSTGYGDQVRDYDIGNLVAQRILDKRATLAPSGYTDLSQLSDIQGFGEDKFNDLIHSFGPAFFGEWELLSYESEVPVVHAALMNNGRVLMFSGTGEVGLPLESAVWNPATGGFTKQYYDDDLFCSHHVFLANGKLLVNGGAIPGLGRGIKVTYLFTPQGDTGIWTKVRDMEFPRWYPTTLTLPTDDGVITFSGRDADGPVVDEVETYDHNADLWETLPDTADRRLEIYPGLHLLATGKILYTGTRWASGSSKWNNPPDTATFDLGTNTWQPVGPLNVKDRTEGMSVILPPDNKRVLVVGGRGDHATETSTDSVEEIDFNDSSPAWRTTNPMNFKRRNVNVVLLPTGNVLVCAGIKGFKSNSDPEPVLEAEEYDPNTEIWKVLATMQIPRLYHSVSLLLPDARVLNLGSVEAGATHWHHLISDMEIFSPPYLFRGPRPSISSAPASVHHGDEFVVETPDAASIAKVVLVRPCAGTHHTDSEQRVVPLEFTQKSSNQLAVIAPESAHPHYDAIGGQYMLFILNKKDVPSVAEFIFLQDEESELCIARFLRAFRRLRGVFGA